jgi:hypothetical protein
MSDRIKNRLTSNNSQRSVNEDSFLKVSLEGNERLLPAGEINHIVDVGERFEYERQSSTCYRFIYSIRTLMSNPLFNITGSNSWTTLNGTDFTSDSFRAGFRDNISFEDSIKAHLKEVDGWFGYLDPKPSTNSLCTYNDMEPTRDRFTFTTQDNTKNWELTITYPISADTTHYLVDGGLRLVESKELVVGGRKMLGLATPVFHNLQAGDSVMIDNVSSGIDGTYVVQRVGDDEGDFKQNYFAIDVTGSTTTPVGLGRMRRVFAGEPSTYYVRKFKKIQTVNGILEDDDYEVYPIAFSKNIFNDEVYQAVFNEDIDVDGLTDNLGRPLSEVYLTTVKNDPSNMFTNIQSGIDMSFLTGAINDTQIANIRRIHDGGGTPFLSHIPLDTNVQITDDTFYGDVAEYNRYQVKETILGDVLHRFNTDNRVGTGSALVSGNRQEGYMYKPHHKIQIRNFSVYIEQGDSSTVGIPNYAEDLGDGRFLWRDLLDIGFDDGNSEAVDYPFLNGCHYLHTNLCFTLKRQDPFDNYGLYSGSGADITSDPIGDAITDRFNVKSSDAIC